MRDSAVPAARGYVLLLVMIVAAAAAAAAAILVVSTGQARITALRTEGADFAAGIADAGMARARAMLATRGSDDFDLDLDPDQVADCTNTKAPASGADPTCATTAKCNVPKLSDGTLVTVDGRNYMRVPFNGGAYLVRYDDDDDDQEDKSAAYAEWADFTGNHLGTAANCVEGTAIPNQGQNHLRDRNRTIWVTVIGIYPGTDFAKAKHRVVLRRLQTANLPTTVAGLQVRGDIHQEDTSTFYACSPIGSVETMGNIEGKSTAKACMCGSSKASGNAVSFAHCDTASICTDPTKVPQPVACADGDAPVGHQSITLPTLGSPTATGASGTDFYVDWSRPCVFYVQNNADALWVWNSNATLGPGATGNPKEQVCRSFEGKGLGMPAPNPDKLFAAAGSLNPATAADWGGCWVPVLWNITGTVAPFTGGGYAETSTRCTDGASKCCGVASSSGIALEADNVKDDDGTGTASCVWKPNTAAASRPFSITWAAGKTQTYTLPDWSTCSISYPPFPVGGAASSTINCAECDGTETAFRNQGGTWWFDVNDAADAKAIPVGVYIYPNGGGVTLSGGSKEGFTIPNIGTPKLPSPDKPMAGWPNATLLVLGNFNSNKRVWLGSGQNSGDGTMGNEPRYASLITSGGLEIQGGGDYFIGGSIYSTGNIHWSGNGDNICWGEIHANGEFHLKGTGNFEWEYATALQSPPSSYSGPALTIPMAR